MGGLVKLSVVSENNDEVINSIVGTGFMNTEVKKLLLFPADKLNIWYQKIKKEMIERNMLLISEDHYEQKSIDLKSPVGYGMVVVDLKNKLIFSHQGFSSISWFRIYELFEIMEEESTNIIPLFEAALRSRSLKGIETLTGKNKSEKYYLDLSGFNGVDFYNLMIGIKLNKTKWNDEAKKMSSEISNYFKERNIEINLDTLDYFDSYFVFNNEFKIKDYQDWENIIVMREDLKNQGFVFEEQEDKVWNNYNDCK